MSFEYYTKWWIKAKQKFEDLYAKDDAFMKKQRPLKDRKLTSKLLGGLYVNYSLIVQEIDACLDQMAQPQKRNTIRKLMDAATVRLLELNNEMRNIEISEYYYVDGNLIEMKLVPYDVEILHPALFYPRPINVEDMWQKIQKGEKIFIPPEPVIEEQVEGLDQEAAQGGDSAAEGAGVEKKEEVVAEAAEKTDPAGGEEGEKKVKDKKDKRPKQPAFQIEQKQLTPEEIKEMERKKALEPGAAKKMPPPPVPEVTNPAANIIQNIWRGYSTRQWVKRKENDRRLLIGMNEPSWKSKEAFERFEKNLNVRREYRDQCIREYVEAIDQERTRILRVVAPGLFEDIGDEIREWFRQFYIRARCFDKIPEEEKGGTVLVIRCETFTPEQYLDDFEKRRKEKLKAKGQDKQKAKELKAKLKKQEADKKKKEAERKKKEAEAKQKKKKKMDEYEYEYFDTTSKPLYNQGAQEHREIWDKINDFENPFEKHYMDMITDEKCYEVQLEVRRQVDELMRIELELLQDALEEDKWKAKGKKGKRKKKNKKKGKKKGKKGKKGKKDPTGDRTTEDLFQELVDNGIIRTYPCVRLREYFGDFSYKNWDLRVKDFDPPATLLDVRQAVIMNCIMPLGVEVMKRPKSVLIAGPRQTGKHLLANAIFTETQCVLFDLSPEVTFEKYTGAKGMKMLIHLINKMTRLLAPSIIYFEAAEKNILQENS
ncbi:hypothetical protein NQ314_005411 [Rhamnusium bicolor]|uniref:ATPase AAA-type core domain-containing protein n=1 Tax=Rhamnusium bicolor TaxID=1586634 RepID=A0AAV8ZHI3_9CUCU|nr:hypothetical protein NQ314_005411 [Rhamnusium bicolor]